MNIEESRTYKLKGRALYFTIVGGAAPTKLLIDGKDIDEYLYLTPLMDDYTRQLAAGTSVADIVRDMCRTPGPTYRLGLILERDQQDGD